MSAHIKFMVEDLNNLLIKADHLAGELRRLAGDEGVKSPALDRLHDRVVEASEIDIVAARQELEV